MSKHRLLLIFLIVLSLIPASGALAQTSPEEVYCGQLSADDCAILQANAEAVYTAFAYATDLSFAIEMGDEELLTFSLASQGAIDQGSEAVTAVFDEIWNTTLGEMRALIRDGEFLNRGLSLTERILRAPAADLVFQIEATLPDMGNTPIPPFNLRILNGVIYVSSPAIDEGLGMPPGTWLSLDVVQGMYMTVDMLSDPALLEGFFESLTSGDMSSGPMIDPQMGGDSEMFNEFIARINAIAEAEYWDAMEDPAFFENILSITRLADDEIDGVAVAVFETGLDYEALVATEEFQMAFNDIFALTVSGMEEIQTEALAAAILDQIAGTELIMTQAIGLEDFYTYRYSFDMRQVIDLQAIAAAFGDEEEGLPVQTQTSSLVTTITDHNVTPEIVAPEDAVSIFDLLGMMNDTSSVAPEADLTATVDIAALLPDTWTEADEGVYTNADGTTLVVQVIPAPSQFVLMPVMAQIGVEEAPEPIEERTLGAIEWTLYAVTSANGSARVALGTTGGPQTYLVLLGPASLERIEAELDLFDTILSAFSQ